MKRAPKIEDVPTREALWDIADEYNRAHLEPLSNTGVFTDAASMNSVSVLAEDAFTVNVPGALLLVDFWFWVEVTAGAAYKNGDVSFLFDGEAATVYNKILAGVTGTDGISGGAKTRSLRVRPGKHVLSVNQSTNFKTFSAVWGYRITFFIPAQRAARF